MTDKAKERLERACKHITLKRLVHDSGEVSEFSKCEDCPAVFLTNHPLGSIAASAWTGQERFTELELDSVLMRRPNGGLE